MVPLADGFVPPRTSLSQQRLASQAGQSAPPIRPISPLFGSPREIFGRGLERRGGAGRGGDSREVGGWRCERDDGGVWGVERRRRERVNEYGGGWAFVPKLSPHSVVASCVIVEEGGVGGGDLPTSDKRQRATRAKH